MYDLAAFMRAAGVYPQKQVCAIALSVVSGDAVRVYHAYLTEDEWRRLLGF